MHIIVTGLCYENVTISSEDGSTYSRKEERELRWKLYMRLVPPLWFNITLGAMDKVTTSTAALYNFRADTGLTGNRYSWVRSAFYVSIPSLARTSPHKHVWFRRTPGANCNRSLSVWLPSVVLSQWQLVA